MTDSCPGLLLDTLKSPQAALALSGGQWGRLLLQARAANLAGTLAERVLALPASARIDAAVSSHLLGARQLSARQTESVRWEALSVGRSLARIGCPVMLLKGAAYVMADLPVAAGRLFGDIDVMVPRERLADAESQLMLSGWASAHTDAYDQRYYRQWMHELPPLTHMRRHTVLDVHHTIVPPTGRARVDVAKLWSAARPVADSDTLRVPADTDLVIHGAAHLFHEGELHNGLRDLLDIDGLLRHFARRNGFWEELIARARDLDLSRPLFYALRYAQRILGTPVPPPALARVGAPAMPMLRLMDALFERGLRPLHRSCDDALSPLARWLLYVRGHWLRMPPHLLAYHLSRKALVRAGDAGDSGA